MDSTRNVSEGVGEHIWLRYATQFTMDGRTYTVEMGIPMPLGASAEMREQLLNEAEAGMNQLSRHVESRVAQMLQRGQPSQAAVPTPAPVAKPSVVAPPRPAQKPAAMAAPQTAAQQSTATPVQVRETAQDQTPPQVREVTVPATRPHVGASMPHAPGASGDSSGNLPLPQFIQHIKDNLGLTPKQAMEMLKVKTLSGINLREALDHLQHLVAQGATGPTTGPGQRAHEVSPTRPEERAVKPVVTPSSRPAPVSATVPPLPQASTPASSTATSTSTAAQTSGKATDSEAGQGSVGAMREERPVYIFDEEVGPQEDEELDDVLDDLDLPRELTTEEHVRAKTLVSRLRESRGATVANANRLQVLSNVAGSQVSEDQLQELVDGVWGVTTLKKMKVDQVEALIYWAKEDDFVNEVEMVLALLEEERYARGNR